MSRQLLEYHPVFGYRFIPHLKARVPHEDGGYLVRANGDGFRCNHEFLANKKERTRRVLLFGDSFSAGDGVANEKRYGDQLESLIPYRRFTILQCQVWVPISNISFSESTSGGLSTMFC